MYDTSYLIYIFRPNSCRGNKVCVVAILGKSRYNAFTSKASIFNPILDADVFQVRPNKLIIPKGLLTGLAK